MNQFDNDAFAGGLGADKDVEAVDFQLQIFDSDKVLND
jgi:hypothetical protein